LESIITSFDVDVLVEAMKRRGKRREERRARQTLDHRSVLRSPNGVFALSRMELPLPCAVKGRRKVTIADIRSRSECERATRRMIIMLVRCGA